MVDLGNELKGWATNSVLMRLREKSFNKYTESNEYLRAFTAARLSGKSVSESNDAAMQRFEINWKEKILSIQRLRQRHGNDPIAPVHKSQ